MPTASSLRGQLAVLDEELKDLRKEMRAALAMGDRISRDDAVDYIYRLNEIDSQIHHLLHELRKTSDVG